MAPTMAYVIDEGDDIQETTDARGEHDILCTEAPTMFQSFTPFLPWQSPDAGESHIAQAAISSVMWAAYKMTDESDAVDEDFVTGLLKPSTMNKTIAKLHEQGFEFTRTDNSWAEARQQLKAFVADRDDAEYYITQVDMEPIEPGAINATPELAAHIRDVTLGELREDLSLSMAPAGTVEVLASPRETLANRYSASLPFMRMVESIANNHRVHDSNVKAMVEQKVDKKRILEKLGDLFPAIFQTSSFPESLLAPNFSRLASRCKKRALLLDNMLTWKFAPTNREDIIRQSFVQFIEPHKNITSIVIPASSQENCYKNVGLLRNQYAPGLQIHDDTALASLNILLKVLVPLVTTDENKVLPGENKTMMVLGKVPLLTDREGTPNTISTSTGSNSTLSGGSGGSAERLDGPTAAWLLTTEPQTLEKKVELLLGTEPPKYIEACTAISRSKLPLYLQTLTTRNSLGNSALARQGKNIRLHRQEMLSFALSGVEDPSTGVVSQHEDYATWLVDSKFDTLLWDGDWHDLNPFEMVFEMQSHKKGGRAKLASEPGPMLWSDSRANRFISEYMDRALYCVSYENGVFTDFIKLANTELENSEGIDDDHSLIVRTRVTAAVLEGLREAGKKFKSCMVTNTHTTKIPFQGKRILDTTNSCYGKLLTKIKSKLDKLDDDDWWLSPDAKATKSSKPADIVALGDTSLTLDDCCVLFSQSGLIEHNHCHRIGLAPSESSYTKDGSKR